jgi:hypothetical protein
MQLIGQAFQGHLAKPRISLMAATNLPSQAARPAGYADLAISMEAPLSMIRYQIQIVALKGVARDCGRSFR